MPRLVLLVIAACADEAPQAHVDDLLALASQPPPPPEPPLPWPWVRKPEQLQLYGFPPHAIYAVTHDEPSTPTEITIDLDAGTLRFVPCEPGYACDGAATTKQLSRVDLDELARLAVTAWFDPPRTRSAMRAQLASEKFETRSELVVIDHGLAIAPPTLALAPGGTALFDDVQQLVHPKSAN